MADNTIEIPGASPAPSPSTATVPVVATENLQLENELPAPSLPADKTGLLETIIKAGRGAAEKFGFPPKRGRGRPAIHGRYSKAAGSDGKTAVKLPGDEYDDDAEIFHDEEQVQITAAGIVPAAVNQDGGTLFRKVCVSSVKSVLGILKEVVRWRAKAAAMDERFTEKALDKCAPDAEALADFTESLDRVLKKRNIQPENAEEWALCISGARLLAPYGLLLKEFQGEIARNRQRDSARPTPPREEVK